MVDIPQTPNFKLFKPPFDRKAWHRYINDNFSIIDAVLTTYLDVGNIVGVWANSTAYLDGDRVIDPDVGQVFEAAVNNTSSPGPTTFAQERVANPTYWTSLAVTARGLDAWAPGTLYQPNDFIVSGTIYAVCVATHTSTGVFANDAVYWDYLIDLSVAITLPSLTGKSLQVLRVNAGETAAEWTTSANIQSWLGLGSAAFVATTTFAAAVHTHTVADLSDASANAKTFLQAANYAAMFALVKQNATDAATGVIEIATDSEYVAKAAADKSLVPSNLAALPTVHAHKNGTAQASITSTADIKLTFSTESWDIGGYFASSTWTPPAGKVRISAQAFFGTTNAVNGELIQIKVYKNGAAVHRQLQYRVGTSFQTIAISVLETANGTDTFEIYVNKGGTGDGNILGDPDGTFISSEMIS